MKPMLAADIEDLEGSAVKWPLHASPKLDGIRTLIVDNKPVTRRLLDVPNRYIREWLSVPELNHLDGELIVGEPNDPSVFSKTYSGVMSHDGFPEATFYVFDTFAPELMKLPYSSRFEHVASTVKRSGIENIVLLRSSIVHTPKEAVEYEDHLVGSGYEGVIFRHDAQPYKFGRSTLNQGALLKLKRFKDAEAVVTGVVEEMHNTNAATTNNIGQTKRSKAKAGLVGKGTMGALKVRGLNGQFKDVEFEIGSGFNAAERAKAWTPGTIVKYKYFPIGSIDRPRHPVFLGLRSPKDMS